MKPVDVRNANFDEIKKHICAKRQRVLDVWRALFEQNGATTFSTREAAKFGGMEILEFRPRTTELVQLGAVVMTARIGHEGVYRVRTEAEWRAWHASLHLNDGAAQPDLDLQRA